MTDQFDAFESDDVLILQRARMFGPHDALETLVVELSFNEFSVFVYVDTADDTLLCARLRPESYMTEHSRLVTSTFWTPLEGRALTDAWQMHNDRGYRDAIQLRFRESASEGAYTIVQLTAVASRIIVSQLEIAREHR